MASSLFPIKGAAYSFPTALVSQADTDIFQVNPTLAAGDVTVSKDFGSLTNIVTLPDAEPDGSAVVRVQLTSTEMNADVVLIKFTDVASAEWQDQVIVLKTAAVGVDSLTRSTVWTSTKAGYLDVALSAIKAKTDLITATAVTVAQPVAAGGDVYTYRGDSYKAEDSRQIEWTIASDANVVGGTVQILLDGVATFTGSVQSAVLLRCQDLTGTQSNGIAEGSHGMQVRVIQADNDVLSKIAGHWYSADPVNE